MAFLLNRGAENAHAMLLTEWKLGKMQMADFIVNKHGYEVVEVSGILLLILPMVHKLWQNTVF